MRFFTPERYLRLGMLNQEHLFRAAHDDWEKALEAYQARLGRIRPLLPAALRRLVDTVYLHDAHVLDMWLGRVRRFTITLRPESAPSRLVVLTYSLKEPPRVKEAVLPPERHSEPVSWLYDELDVRKPTGSNGQRRRRGDTTFIHNILLSNGWELRLHFHDVKVTRPDALLPSAPSNGAGRAAISSSANS